MRIEAAGEECQAYMQAPLDLYSRRLASLLSATTSRYMSSPGIHPTRRLLSFGVSLYVRSLTAPPLFYAFEVRW